MSGAYTWTRKIHKKLVFIFKLIVEDDTLGTIKITHKNH